MISCRCTTTRLKVIFGGADEPATQPISHVSRGAPPALLVTARMTNRRPRQCQRVLPRGFARPAMRPTVNHLSCGRPPQHHRRVRAAAAFPGSGAARRRRRSSRRRSSNAAARRIRRGRVVTALQFLLIVVAVSAALSAIMAGAWLVWRSTRNSGWVDTVWTFGLGAVGCVGAVTPLASVRHDAAAVAGRMSDRRLVAAARPAHRASHQRHYR